MKKKFLVQLFSKAGVQVTPELQTILDAATDETVITDLPDTIQNSVVSGVLSVKDAQTHPDLVNHFKGQFFGVTDAAARQAMVDEGFTEEEIKTTLEGKPSDEKIKAAAKAIKARTGKPTDQISKELTAALNAEKAERAKDKQAYDEKLNLIQGEFSAYKRNTAIESLLNSGEYKIKTGGLDKSKIFKLIKEDLQDFASQNGIDLQLSENGTINLVNTKTPGADFYLNNQKIDGFKPVLQHVLTTGKYLDDAAGEPTKTVHTADTGGHTGTNNYKNSFMANFGKTPAEA